MMLKVDVLLLIVVILIWHLEQNIIEEIEETENLEGEEFIGEVIHILW